MSACAGRRLVHQRIGVDEREILSLPWREIRVRITFARFIVALDSGGSVMNIRLPVELNEGERAQLTAMLSGGNMRRANSNGRKFCWPPTPGSATRRSRALSRLAGPRFTGPNGASWRATLSSH